MKRTTILPFALALITISCDTEKEEKIETASYKDLVSKYEMGNGRNFIFVNRGDTALVSVELKHDELDSLESYKYFNIEFKENNGKNELTKIEKTKQDTTWKHDLLIADESCIEDYKRKKEGSYAIIEQGEGNDLIVVSTPSQEISNMLRIESFQFYYYQNWDGKFYFDHIEEQQ